MGRPACSSCCKITDPPTRPECIVDDFKFYYELGSGSPLAGGSWETLDYIDLLVKAQRKGPHDVLSRVTQFIKKRDFGEYRTILNAFSWSLDNEFDVISYERPIDEDYLTNDLTTGYFAPRKFNVYLGVSDWNKLDYGLSITRELELRPVELVSSGESYGIQDWQFTKKGVQENGGDPNAFPEGSVEKGCSNEKTLEFKYDVNVGAALRCALNAARDGALFNDPDFPRDRTNIQVKRITWLLGYKQIVDLKSDYATAMVDLDSSGPSTFFRGIPVYIQYQVFNFGKQLFVSDGNDSTCSMSQCPGKCAPKNDNDPYLNGWSFDIRTAKVLDEEGFDGVTGEKAVEKFLEEYRSIPYCLTYPFLKMDDGTYHFSNKESEMTIPRFNSSLYTRQGFINSGRWDGIPLKFTWGGKIEPNNMPTAGTDPVGSPLVPANATLQPTNHFTPKAMTSIKVENLEFLWFNPYCVEAKFHEDEYDVPFEDTNGGVNGAEPGVGVIIGYEDPNFPRGKELEQWTSIFPDSNSEKLTPVPEPAQGEDRTAYEEYVSEFIKLLLYYNGDPAQSPIKGLSPIKGKEQSEYVKGPAFEFVDNKLKGNEYDIPQKQYLHIKHEDLLYNVYEMILSKNPPAAAEAPNDFNIDNTHMWTKWHENVIVVQVRSEQSAEDWLKRTGVSGATVREGDEVYHPVGSCTETTIKTINYDGVELNKIDTVELESGQTVFLNDIELKKDTITYGIDGRVYRLWMWLESKNEDRTYKPSWEPESETDKVYKPLQHKLKNIYIENFERPTTVGPEVSSYNLYPTNDTRVNLVTETSFKELAEPRKKEDKEPHVLSIYNVGTCSTKPEDWSENFGQFDDNDFSYRETKVPFYYLNEDDEAVGRLLSDDKVLTIGKKERGQYIKPMLKCENGIGDNPKHWHLDSWLYYYPEKGGESIKSWHEPELEGFSESCRRNPYAITAKHIFPKTGNHVRVPYLEKAQKTSTSQGEWSSKTADFSFTQTPDRGYLFTTLGFEANDSWYRITFEFEDIIGWRERTLEELRGDN